MALLEILQQSSYVLSLSFFEVEVFVVATVQKGPLDVGDSMPLIVFFAPAVLNYIHIETEIRRLVPSLLTAQHTFTG